MQNELKSRGHDVTIITPLPREMPNSHVDERVLFIGSGAQVKSFHTTAQVSATIAPDKLEEALDKQKFDILHFHEPWVPMISRQILTRSKTVNIATFHAKLPDTVMTRTIERVITPYTRSILKYLNSLTAVSDAAAQYVHGLTDQPVEIIPNGINLELYKPSEISNPSPMILYVGRLEKRKGVKYLLKAMAILQIHCPGARLVIAGDGPDREKLESYAAEKGLSSVSFLGFVSQEEKIRLMQNARVFCSPALYGESFGIVLLEAMACGTPVVAGNNPGYAAVLKEQQESSLVSPKDTDDLAAHLIAFLQNSELHENWRKWGLKNVSQYNYIKIVDSYEELYRNLTAGK